MRSAKQILRKEIKKKLSLLTESEKLHQSEIIAQKLFKNPIYIKSQRISVYMHMKNEVKTNAILEKSFEYGKKIYIPKYVGSNMDMVELFSMKDFNDLPETSWHIKQPLDEDNSRENAIDNGGLDLIVVPGVGFTLQGDRLGHGKGYYDTYIEKISATKRPYLIGLGFNVQICDEIPTNHDDKCLDEVLTSYDIN